MASEGNIPIRDRHEVAAELSRETNSELIAELSEELLRAFDAEKMRTQPTTLPQRIRSELRVNAVCSGVDSRNS